MNIKIVCERIEPQPLTRGQHASEIPVGTVFYGHVPGIGRRLLLKTGYSGAHRYPHNHGIVDLSELAKGANGLWEHGSGASDLVLGYMPVNVTITVEEIK